MPLNESKWNLSNMKWKFLKLLWEFKIREDLYNMYTIYTRCVRHIIQVSSIYNKKKNYNFINWYFFTWVMFTFTWFCVFVLLYYLSIFLTAWPTLLHLKLRLHQENDNICYKKKLTALKKNQGQYSFNYPNRRLAYFPWLSYTCDPWLYYWEIFSWRQLSIVIVLILFIVLLECAIMSVSGSIRADC